MFSWKPIYREIAEALMGYRERQTDLLGIVKEMGDAGLPVISMTDEAAGGAAIELAEIDPFTFFANFNRGTTDHSRREIVRITKQRFDCTSDRIGHHPFADLSPCHTASNSWFSRRMR